MKTEFKILEGTNRNGTFTIKIEGTQMSFNHTHIHERNEFEDFEPNNLGHELIKGRIVYHINGHIITLKEFNFLKNVIEDL